MKTYPSISPTPSYRNDYLVFDKLDGSNIRAEWTRKKGFDKFGSRKMLLSDRMESDQQSFLSKAIDLVKAHEDRLAKVFVKEQFDRRGSANTPVVCFFELWGANSFAGLHDPNDEHEVTLLDVSVHKHGLLDPREFVKLFEGAVPTPKLLHRGFNKEIEEAVRAGTLPDMTFEGIVAKGPRRRNSDALDAFKVKNRAWVERVKGKFGAQAGEFL